MGNRSPSRVIRIRRPPFSTNASHREKPVDEIDADGAVLRHLEIPVGIAAGAHVIGVGVAPVIVEMGQAIVEELEHLAP
jgi:hypothetical protein